MREQIEALVREALHSYRLHYTVEDDGGGLPLVDALTPASDKTIARGQAEREALGDYIVAHIATRLAAIAQGVGEVTDEMVERALWQYHNTALSGSEGSIDAIRRKKMRAALTAAFGRTDTGEG